MRKSSLGLLFLALVCFGLLAAAQSTSPQPQKPPDQKPVDQKPAEQKPPVDVTGPDRPVGESVAIPRKNAPSKKTPPRQPADANVPKPQGQPYGLSVDVNIVSVDVVVADKQGHFIPSLTKKNFRVLEDGVPQQIQQCASSEAPMTVVMVIEFDNRYQRFWTETWYQTLTASYGFLQTLRPEDWVAIVAYDMRPEIIQDFTQNKQEAMGSMRRLQFPGFSEANLFDALDDVLNRLKDVDGKKGVVLISTGIDTFSKLTYDKILREVQEAQVPIYPIGMMQMVRDMADAYGYMGAIQRLDFLQADNAMKTFASLTGGAAYFPRFYGEFPSIYENISARMRNQYTLTYSPTNPARDGKFRKLKVEVLAENGQPLKVVDQKGKEVKIVITARNGYYAPKGETMVQ